MIFNRNVKRDFPEPIRSECYGALNYAEEVIKNVNVHRIKPRSVKVELIPGTRKFGNQWAFHYKDNHYPNGIWVLGICLNNGTLLQIAVDPNNKYNVPIETLRHEFAHHWLLSNNHHDMHHYPIYDQYFEGWADSRRATGMGSKNNEYEIKEFSYYSQSNGMVVVTGVFFEED